MDLEEPPAGGATRTDEPPAGGASQTDEPIGAKINDTFI